MRSAAKTRRRAGRALVLFCALLAVAPPALARGAVASGRYRDLFREWRPSLTVREEDTKIDAYWQSLFEGDANHRVYHAASATADGPSAYILDIGNEDVRSEGMSYGMMIAVQTGHKAAFDALWNWAATHMRYASGPRAGYFRWQCDPQGCPRDTAPASDGEEYFATALFFAAHRWPHGQGIYDYAAQANAILDTMLHKQAMNGGVVDGVTDMIDAGTDQIVFVPLGAAARFTDPSYHLPAFYLLWARWATGWHGQRRADRRRWRRVAVASRRLFSRSAHPVTALTPDYARFDGTAEPRDGHGTFGFDAFRTAVNWSVDQAWWSEAPAARDRSRRLLASFARQGIDRYPATYRLDGTPLSADRSPGLIACNAVAALALDRGEGAPFVARLWALPPPSGRFRYYDGMLQFMAVLHASGRFRAW